MESFTQIREFLWDSGKRLKGHTAWRLFFLALAAVLVLALASIVMAARADALGTAGLQLALGIVIALVCAAAVTARVWLGRRLFSRPTDLARVVGEKVPGLASDLLSSVQLEAELEKPGEPRFSRELTLALASQTAARTLELRPETLLPRGRVRRMAGLAALAAFLHLVVFFAWPNVWRTGAARLMNPPAPGLVIDADVVDGPVVGDLKITLRYPKYTGRAMLVIPNSSGDVETPRGTEIEIETTALSPAKSARIVFGDDASGTARTTDPITMQVDGHVLRAKFVAKESTAFRFVLQPPTGRAVVEAAAHTLDIEPDHAPRVDLVVPADQLEVSSRRRVELAYSVEDDYGLKDVTLIWRAESGRDERVVIRSSRPTPTDGPPSQPLDNDKSVRGTFLWDLADLPLEPGARISYRLEARDNDDVVGPNVGSSRTYTLRVFSPLERHELLLSQQQAVFELALRDLGGRLVLLSGDGPAGDPVARRNTVRRTHRLVSELGQLAGLLEKDTFAPKRLKPVIETMRKRLGALVQKEDRHLIAAEKSQTGAQLQRTARVQLDGVGRRLVTTLEKDVLTMHDWIERQKLENILAVNDEIRAHRERLAKLLAEYERTESPEVRAEIEHELRALERRLAELQQRLARLSAGFEDRFLNRDALSNKSEDCIAQVRKLVQAGRMKKAQKVLERCSKDMEDQQKSLEQALQELRGEKFAEEQKALSELMDDVAELEDTQDKITREADEILDSYKKKAADVVRQMASELRDEAKKTARELEQKLNEIPQGGLTSFSQEELDFIKKRTDDVKKMIDRGDLAEALAMAQEAEVGLHTLQADVDDDLSESREPAQQKMDARDRAQEASDLASELVKQLESATPSPQEIMGKGDRARMDQLRKRQGRLSDRLNQLMKKVDRQKGKLPGKSPEVAKESLSEAGEQMGRAKGRFGAKDPMGARDESRGAAEKLQQMRKNLQRAARPTGTGRTHGDRGEPVRIPGRDEYRAPREFREDLMDAMRQEAPEKYEDMVKRYYRELIK